MSERTAGRAVEVTVPGQVRLVDLAEADVPTGYARISVAYVGICHTDVAAVAAGTGALPRRIGHEASGTVVESRIPSIPVGARVVAYVSDAYATEVIAPAAAVIPIDDACSLRDAALAEPVACAIGGIEALDLRAAREVVVVGTGFMGLLAVRLLALRGIRSTAIDPREPARRAALAWGASAAHHPDSLPARLAGSVPVVVESSGSASGLELASSLVGIDGVLGILGYHQSEGGVRTVPMREWNYRAIRVLNLHHRDRAAVAGWIDRAQRLGALGLLRPSELADDVVGLDDALLRLRGEAPPSILKTLVDVASTV